MIILFDLFITILFLSSLIIILQKNIIYSLFFFILFTFSIAGIFFIFQASFLGALEIIIYAGAVVVLFLFMIMISNFEYKNYINNYILLFQIFIISIILFLSIRYFGNNFKTFIVQKNIFSDKIIGINLFKCYALLIELLSILLISGLVIVYCINKDNFYLKNNE